ncbi:MAG TPA: hypothetical protein PLC98_13970 [Anaerolineales bacterium]|nr:hypothetical protein [Anaerolineales bacterium]
MQAQFETDGAMASFRIVEAEPAVHEALIALYYQPDGMGFSKQFAADTPDLDAIFRRFAQSAEALVRQAAGHEPVDWEVILERLLERARGHDVDWCLVGSAALAVRGLDVHPGDVDLVTSERGAEQLEALLHDLMIEPLQRSEGWIWRSFGRAFPGGRLEWVGGVNDGADQPEVSDFGPTALARLETVRWRGVEIKVPPLDLQLAVSERRGRHERAALIRRHLSGG